MGFWDVTKRLVQGKPAFEAPTDKDDWDDTAPTTDFAEDREARPQLHDETSLIDVDGHKHIPVAAVTNVKTTQSGEHIEVWATISNQSDRELRLDKMILLGTTFAMNYPLHANSQRVFRVYSGTQFTHGSYKKADLYYQDIMANDYFKAEHLVEYRYESDGTYDINDFNLVMPIRDV